ncbi:hypothetical protein ACLH0K_14245 [Arthrobacter sp. MPF02]|uniref:hypothetical protein n=1 Tax=Arthrobacter sp. MPF02 TaxID=3388492 RepID=UPI003984B0B8
MSITTASLTRSAGLCAAAAGVLFIGVQVNHPHLDAEFATTTEYSIRQGLKVLMGVLSLAGITGMYLHQVRRAGVPGLVGYLLFGTSYIIMTSVELIGAVVLPTLARSDPGYVNNVFAMILGEPLSGDLGGMLGLNIAAAATFLGGGLVFGIALFRAGVLARWAAALLAAGSVATLVIPLLPQVNERLFAIPAGIAMIGLGYSLWRSLSTPEARLESNTEAGRVGAP